MNYIVITLLLLLSYLIGSIPTGYLLVKYIKKTDIRKEGSQSTGATNTTRVLGFKFGVLAFLIDGIKGIIVMALLLILKLDQFYLIGDFHILGFYGLMGAIGHVFPIFLGFKGGKAVATSLGIIIFLSPVVGIFAFLLFVILVLTTKYISLSSILSSTIAAILVLILAIFNIELFRGFVTPGLNYVPLGYAISLLSLVIIIDLKHSANIKRIINGTESKVKFLNKK